MDLCMRSTSRQFTSVFMNIKLAFGFGERGASRPLLAKIADTRSLPPKLVGSFDL
jgi:hypothetical protein